ncbi:MAG: alkaline phosphatase family protein [Betaproteobacteria bacterium]|nr:alkaline phosphatase family protein [Betaproteobacteria bacterium]
MALTSTTTRPVPGAAAASPPACLPDYHGGSLVNLMASVAAARGAGSAYAPLRGLDAATLAHARNIVLILIDGLGYNYLNANGRGGALHRHLKGPMTSVFPPTTAAAITTLHTGVAPQQHGLTGWFTYFREVGDVLAVLPFRSRHGGSSLTTMGIEPAQLFSAPAIFDSLACPSWIVSHKSIVDSDYNLFHSGNASRVGYDNLKHFFQAIELTVKENREPKYVYAYYPELDALSHTFGASSPPVAKLFRKIDALFEELLEALAGTDSVVIVTADHGFVDVKPEETLELANFPRLAETLVLPLCGGRRVGYCYVHPEKTRQFEDYARELLAPYADLYRSADLIERGWFGLGAPHPRLHERIGHYALVMKGNYAIKDWVLGERHHVHLGAHGGVSAAEMLIPLVVAEV